jgi:NAD(P)-dependent dehydrogenase (short-subunit alcohol dehydrogenase family)
MRLKGKVCLVTGGAQRLGRAIALEMAAQGCAVALHYHRSAAEAHTALTAIRALGVDCRLFQADLSKSAPALGLAKAVIKSFGACDVLVNSAAVFPRTSLEQARPADFDGPYALNLRAPALLTKAMGLWNLDHRRSARIINIGDVGGQLAWPGALPYSLSKAGLVQLTRASARALAPYVLVNCVALGPMLAPPADNPAQKRASLRRTLLKRLGGAREAARAVAFLAASDYITGAVLPVDGGRSLVP